MDKKYIRLRGRRTERWYGQVAKFAEEREQGPNAASMILFYDPQHPSRKRILSIDKVEFISSKEYFASVLRGELFDN